MFETGPVEYPCLFVPPLVELVGGKATPAEQSGVGYLLAWEFVEVAGSWWAIVTYVAERSYGRRWDRMVVTVRAETVRPLGMPAEYERVPRFIRARDGSVRRRLE